MPKNNSQRWTQQQTGLHRLERKTTATVELRSRYPRL